MNLRLTVVIIFLCLGLQTRSQSLESIQQLLNEISFHQRTDSSFLKNDAILRRIEVIAFSFKVDGRDITYPGLDDEIDSTTLFLLGIKKGDIIPYGENGGCLLLLKTDSVLAYRVALQSFSLQTIDTLFERVKKISGVQEWNTEWDRYHHWEGEFISRKNQYIGSTGWFEPRKLFPDLEEKIKNHKKGDLFVFKTDEMGWIVLKTDKEKYFTRKYLVYLEPKK